MGNRDEIPSSERCGCFHCLEIFLPMEVKDWIGERGGRGQTALCPRCGIDSVVGSGSGYPITIEFLRLMKEHWFSLEMLSNQWESNLYSWGSYYGMGNGQGREARGKSESVEG